MVIPLLVILSFSAERVTVIGRGKEKVIILI